MLEFASSFLNKHKLPKSSVCPQLSLSRKQIKTDTTISQYQSSFKNSKGLSEQKISHSNQAKLTHKSQHNNQEEIQNILQKDIFSEQYLKCLKSQIKARVIPESTVIEALKQLTIQNRQLKTENQVLRSKIEQLQQDNQMLIEMMDSFKQEAELQSKLAKQKLDDAYTTQSKNQSTISDLNKELQRLSSHIKALQTFLAKKYKYDITFISTNYQQRNLNDESNQTQDYDYCIQDSSQISKQQVNQFNQQIKHQKDCGGSSRQKSDQFGKYLSFEPEYF